MSEICANCKEKFTGNFCSNCGQKKYKRIDRAYLLNEMQYTILHTNKGFFFTVKSLIKNPGKTALEFINGKRVNHYKPILLAFVLTGLTTFLAFKVIGIDIINPDIYYGSQEGTEAAIYEKIMLFYTKYFTVIMMLLIPVFALVTKAMFRKWGHNYYEHIVMNAFFYSAYSIYSMIFMYPILYFVRENVVGYHLVTYLFMLLTPFLLVWFLKEIYKNKPMGVIAVKVIWVYVILFLLLILSVIMGGLVLGLFMT